MGPLCEIPLIRLLSIHQQLQDVRTREETRFLWDDLSVCRGILQPSQKPDVIPAIKKCVSCLLG